MRGRCRNRASRRRIGNSAGGPAKGPSPALSQPSPPRSSRVRRRIPGREKASTSRGVRAVSVDAQRVIPRAARRPRGPGTEQRISPARDPSGRYRSPRDDAETGGLRPSRGDPFPGIAPRRSPSPPALSARHVPEASARSTPLPGTPGRGGECSGVLEKGRVVRVQGRGNQCRTDGQRSARCRPPRVRPYRGCAFAEPRRHWSVAPGTTRRR